MIEKYLRTQLPGTPTIRFNLYLYYPFPSSHVYSVMEDQALLAALGLSIRSIPLYRDCTQKKLFGINICIHY
jgi:hypothetical protein